MPVVGMVGLGGLGGVIAARLLAGGYEVRGFRRDAAGRGAFAAAGGTAVGSVGEVAADVVVLCLDTAGALLSVVADVSPSLTPGTVVVEMSTVELAAKMRARDALAAVGVKMVDAPVSGTPPMILGGRAVLLVGGDDDAVATARPVLDAIATARRVGGFGDGTRAKYVANALVAVHSAAAAEAIALAERFGLDTSLLVDALVGGPASSSAFDVRAARMAARDHHVAQGTVGGLGGDARMIRSAAAEHGAATPLLDTAGQLFDDAIAAGFAALDVAALVEVAADRIPHG